MKRIDLFVLTTALGAALFISGAVTLAGQSTELPSAPKLSAEQRTQLDQLKQLEQQLEKDRQAMHNAITQYGWDSEQADQAEEKLSGDRLEYRRLRRSLRSAGVPVPPPSGLGRAGQPGSPDGPWFRGPRGRWTHHGCGHHCAGWGCRDCGW